MRMVSLLSPLALSCVCLLLVVVAETANAADWPQFLGPDRNGISKETGLIDNWPANGLTEVWRVEGGVGMSAVAIQEGTACTMIQTGGQQKLLALDAASGESKWATPITAEFRNSMGDGPRGTPTLHNGAAYVFTGDGTLARVNLKTGKVDWKVDTLKRHRGKTADYGMACSPVIWGDNVIVTIGGAEATVAAFDQKTGETVWTAGKGENAGYSSPAILNVGGQSQLVVFAAKSAFGVDAKGASLWRFPYITAYDCNTATPIAVSGNVFISAGENHGSTLLSLEKSGSGFEPGTVWESTGGGSVMRNEWQTSILIGKYLYGFDNVGSAGPVTHLACIEAKTGKPVWREPRFGKGNLIAADGKLFISTMAGELVVVRVNPEKYDELGRQSGLTGKTRQSPSLSNGRLYLRDDAEVICLDARAAN